MKKVALNFILLLFLSQGVSLGAFALPSQNPLAIEILEKMPVQHGGRIKPFQTFAQEAVMYITETIHFEGLSATEVVWQWMVDPVKWNAHPLIKVTHPALRDEFSVMLIKNRLSPEIILNHQPLIEQVQAAYAKQAGKETLSLEEKKRLELYEKAALFRDIGEGQLPGWIAQPGKSTGAWLSFQDMMHAEGQPILNAFFPEGEAAEIRQALNNLFMTLRTDFDSAGSPQAAEAFAGVMRRIFQARGIILDEKILSMESRYNFLRPFAWAWKIYLAAVLLALLVLALSGFGRKTRALSYIALAFFLSGFALHAYGFYLRCMIAGRPPVSNMYESIVWVSWGIVLFSIILSFFYRTELIRIFAGVVATFALVIAQSFPALLDPFITPLVPVLRSNMWLTVHVLTITLSYGAFALAWGLGHGAVFHFAFAPERASAEHQLTLFLYRAVQIGVVMLASGTVLGGVWANYSWGRFWGWDPKETWALIALLGYVLVLHGRVSGWLGPFGFAMGVVLAFLGIVMAWYGVNFVLAAGLHSYGFGGGGLPYVLAVIGLDLMLLLGAAIVYHQNQKRVLV